MIILFFSTLIYSSPRLKILGLKSGKHYRKKVKFLLCIEVSIQRNFKQKEDDETMIWVDSLAKNMLPPPKFKPQNPLLHYDGLGQCPWSPMLDFRATLKVVSTCLERFKIFEVNGICSSISLFKMDCRMRDGLWWISTHVIAWSMDDTP